MGEILCNVFALFIWCKLHMLNSETYFIYIWTQILPTRAIWQIFV